MTFASSQARVSISRHGKGVLETQRLGMEVAPIDIDDEEMTDSPSPGVERPLEEKVGAPQPKE
jgi:hypothetical protein